MFLGHFAAAFALAWALPSVPAWVPLVGVSLPDLLFGALLLAGVEDVDPDPDSPLWTDVAFTSYPYSHSLVVGTLLAAVPGALLAGVVSPAAGVAFVVASASHWVLDAVVHGPDLPVVGAGDDRRVGLGGWRYPVAAYLGEFGLYAVAVLLALDRGLWVPALGVGAVVHLATANAAFGLTDANPVATRGAFAAQVLGGYAVAVGALWYVLGA